MEFLSERYYTFRSMPQKKKTAHRPLSRRTPPMSEQAQSVLELTYKHNYIHFARWAMIETSLEKYDLPRTPATTEMLDALELDTISLQRSAATPKAHRYRLIKG